ncbi:putative; ORF located using Glimmer/Genemark [uncultured Candidatus Thioglobus sp.]|nr:putative; ORF located using Glimmer/Genemark [uncultured Candidatus Thioglobus sp.]
MKKFGQIPISIANKRFTRRLKSKYKKNSKGNGGNSKNSYKDETSVVKLPETLNINTHRNELVKIIFDIRKMFKSNPSNFVLDHSTIKKVDIPALLVLASEIQRNTFYRSLTLRSQAKYRPKDPQINKMLECIGYWKHFGINTISNNNINSNFHLKITDGCMANFAGYTKIRQFYATHIGISNLDIIEKLDDAITESIANATEHAYTVEKILRKRSSLQMPKHWWLCGFYDEESKILQFICYDQGVGLKAAVNYNDTIGIRRNIKDLMSFSDSAVIKTLLKKDLTKYNKKDRGYGFKRFEELIDEYDTGKLEIYSQKGYCCVDKNSGTKTISQKDFTGVIEGTLISWQLKIEDKK